MTDPPRQPERDEATQEGRCNSWRSGRWVLVWTLGVLVAMSSQSMLLRHGGPWPAGVEVSIALIPVVFFAGMFFSMWRHVLGLDEMQRRMQLEALALTVIIASMICLTVGQLQKIESIGLVMLDDAWVIIAFTYVASNLLVKLRYR